MSAKSVGQIALDLVVNKNGFEKQMAGIQKLAKNVGKALVSAFAVKKIVDFGKECLELGSDLAEVQNVVGRIGSGKALLPPVAVRVGKENATHRCRFPQNQVAYEKNQQETGYMCGWHGCEQGKVTPDTEHLRKL